MVFYFSGTGNSSYVAKTISNFLGLKTYFIPEIDPKSFEMPENRVIFVFPVYSWGVPPLVSKFITEVPNQFWDNLNSSGYSVDCVMTCGDEVALAPEMISRNFREVGVKLTSIWSVIMPNNYVLLPGFDVDPKAVEENKLEECKQRILEITQALSRGERRVDVVRGKLAWLKTKIVFPLFRRWGINPTKWHWRDTCISCGKCAKICPLLNITMEAGHPLWGRKCCSCLGCYHVCPVHAVEYGRETIKKGQYLFPLKRT